LGFELDDGTPLLASPEQHYSPSDEALNDYWWGGGPPAVTQIPYSWLTQNLGFRRDKPYNVADVTRTSGFTARSLASLANRQRYREQTFTATLDTAVDADAPALATHVVTYRSTPRDRCPQITIDLLQRDDLDRWTVLGREVGDRIQITGAPATWPEGTTSLVIEGIQHTIGIDARVVVWNTVPVSGAAAGVPGPWFYADDSVTGGTDKAPF